MMLIMARGNPTGGWVMQTRVKDKPNAQGTLFSGGQSQIPDDKRYFKGYNPERSRQLREAENSGAIRFDSLLVPEEPTERLNTYRRLKNQDPRRYNYGRHGAVRDVAHLREDLLRSTAPLPSPASRTPVVVYAHAAQAMPKSVSGLFESPSDVPIGGGRAALSDAKYRPNQSSIYVGSTEQQPYRPDHVPAIREKLEDKYNIHDRDLQNNLIPLYMSEPSRTLIHEYGHFHSHATGTPHSAINAPDTMEERHALHGEEEAYAENFADKHHRPRKGEFRPSIRTYDRLALYPALQIQKSPMPRQFHEAYAAHSPSLMNAMDRVLTEMKKPRSTQEELFSL